VGDGDGVDLVEGEVGLLEGFAEDGEDVLDVGAAGDFGDDAAVFGVEMGLGGDDVAEDFVAVGDDGGGGFVAGGFEAQNKCHGERIQKTEDRRQKQSMPTSTWAWHPTNPPGKRGEEKIDPQRGGDVGKVERFGFGRAG